MTLIQTALVNIAANHFPNTHIATIQADRNEMSGYVLRKFRNSSGWQRLWLVYAHFCVFFFKTHLVSGIYDTRQNVTPGQFQDDVPLASLPLIGYNVGIPEPADELAHKEHIIKLQFKTHFYFFRADCDYSFHRYSTRFSLQSHTIRVIADGWR